MTIEIDDAVLDQGCLADTIRVAIVYIFYRLRQGVEQPHPDRHDRDWYKNFTDDVYRALRLRRLLEALDPSERKESETWFQESGLATSRSSAGASAEG